MHNGIWDLGFGVRGVTIFCTVTYYGCVRSIRTVRMSSSESYRSEV
jgi:hypothetical protein